MRKNVRSWIVLLLPATAALSQQTTGSISGSVREASGLALSGARLKLVNAANAAERTVQSNESGDFVVNGLDPGQYTLSVQASGFKTLERSGIALSASERLSVGNLTLDLGNVSERVTVTAQGHRWPQKGFPCGLAFTLNPY